MSSDESGDELSEEEIIQNLDNAAKQITNNLLPEKSKIRYNLCYEEFLLWQQIKKTSSFTENVLLVYFHELSKTKKPTTLWSQWSMLRSTLNLRNGIDINNYHNLKVFIKNCAKGYHPKKARVLTFSQVNKFLNESDDLVHFANKVILTFGIFGALRTSELCNINVQDVQDAGNQLIVTIRDNKNCYPRNFVVGEEYYKVVQKYISLRPKDYDSRRFFFAYHMGKSKRQVIGKNKISEVPKAIAEYLKLENPETYTGHCFRRTAATLLANSGANLTAVKQSGGWRSSTVAEGYIEHSLANRRQIYNQIISSAHQAPTYKVPSATITNDAPSTSASNQVSFNFATNGFPSTSTFNEAPSNFIISRAPNTSTTNKTQFTTTNQTSSNSQKSQKKNLKDLTSNEIFLMPDSDDELFLNAKIDGDFDFNKNLNTSTYTPVSKMYSTEKRKSNEIQSTACSQRVKKLSKLQDKSKLSSVKQLKNDEVEMMTLNSSFVTIENCTIGHLTIYKNHSHSDHENNL